MSRIQIAARPELAEADGGPLKHIRVLYEDEFLLALEKPRGMHSVVHTVEDPLTVADCVSAYCLASLGASADKREAGLVQRLDYYTSGVLLAAKSEVAWASLHQMFLGSAVRKSYLALIEGTFESSTICVSLPLRQNRSGKKMLAAPNAKFRQKSFLAETKFEHLSTVSIDSAKKFSIVRAQAQHVVRHQIRVHLASNNHPLVGDELYGSQWRLTEILRELRIDPGQGKSPMDGFLLHAETLEFLHPLTHQRLHLTSDSNEFKQLLALTKRDEP